MNPKSQTETLFVKRDFDEFENITTTTHVKGIFFSDGYRSDGIPNRYEISLQYKKSLHGESLQAVFSSVTESWFWAKHGTLCFNCDQEIHDLSPGANHSTVKSGYVIEIVGYPITKDLLKQICDAKILKIRISGDTKKIEPPEKWCVDLQTNFKQFYNNVFDSTLYTESLAAAPSGCFIATACYGDYNHQIVMELRSFRDDCLEVTGVGRCFVRWYYSWSPAFASLVAKSQIFKTLARVLIVTPVLAVARIIRKTP